MMRRVPPVPRPARRPVPAPAATAAPAAARAHAASPGSPPATLPATLPAPGEGRRGRDGHIAYLLRQAHGAVRGAMDAELAAAGLTTPQFLVLNLLDAYPGASGADVARIAMLTPQTVNGIVRRLLDDGMIARTHHETHGRVLRMGLTPQGTAVLGQCKQIADRVEARLLALADAPSQAVVRDWLAAVALVIAAPSGNAENRRAKANRSERSHESDTRPRLPEE
jgi:DNA-binding MarR family transcriptional regulator